MNCAQTKCEKLYHVAYTRAGQLLTHAFSSTFTVPGAYQSDFERALRLLESSGSVASWRVCR